MLHKLSKILLSLLLEAANEFILELHRHVADAPPAD